MEKFKSYNLKYHMTSNSGMKLGQILPGKSTLKQEAVPPSQTQPSIDFFHPAHTSFSHDPSP